MKTIFLIRWLCCLFLLIGMGNISQAQELEGKFRIRWRLNNIPDSVRGVIYIFSPTMTPSKAIADFSLQNGEMIYEDTISQPKHLKFFGWAEDFPNWTLDLWVDQGGWIDIQGKDKWLHQWIITANIPQQKKPCHTQHVSQTRRTNTCVWMKRVKHAIVFGRTAGINSITGALERPSNI